MHIETITSNLKLKTVDPSGKKNKKLAVVCTWLLAQDRHIDKIRNVYISKDFDVLTLETFPMDFLFPTTGTQVRATELLDYLEENSQYDKIVMHAFSVGGYLMGEMFIKMRENSEKYADISKKVKGVVLDSAVDYELASDGFARAVSRNAVTAKVLQWYINAHLYLMYNVATKHYIKSSNNFHDTPLLCPALCFLSEADKIGTPEANEKVMNNWSAKGVDCTIKMFKDSKHVGHFFKYQNEYIGELDTFLLKVNLISK